MVPRCRSAVRIKTGWLPPVARSTKCHYRTAMTITPVALNSLASYHVNDLNHYSLIYCYLFYYDYYYYYT